MPVDRQKHQAPLTRGFAPHATPVTCPHCARIFPNEKGRNSHISGKPECLLAQQQVEQIKLDRMLVDRARPALNPQLKRATRIVDARDSSDNMPNPSNSSAIFSSGQDSLMEIDNLIPKDNVQDPNTANQSTIEIIGKVGLDFIQQTLERFRVHNNPDDLDDANEQPEDDEYSEGEVGDEGEAECDGDGDEVEGEDLSETTANDRDTPNGRSVKPASIVSDSIEYKIHKDPRAAHVYSFPEDDLLPKVPRESDFEKFRKTWNRDRPYHPFGSGDEWKLVKWLMTSKLNKAAIDNFLKLDWVLKNPVPLSFSSADELYSTIHEELPDVPEFSAATITLKDTPNEPQTILYRNPQECADFLFQNPAYRGHMDYAASEIFGNGDEGRIYHEMSSGLVWNELEHYVLEEFGDGITIRSVVLGSDATHLTNFSGDKSVHMIYMTLGNIRKDIRNKPSFGGWMVLAYLPKPKFAKTKFKVTQTAAEEKDMPGLCRKIFIHEALRHILAPIRLRLSSIGPRSRQLQEPAPCLDPDGQLRKCVTVLMAWCTDLQEHNDILCVGSNSCVKCLARFKQLDMAEAGVTRCRDRTGKWILAKLWDTRQNYPNATTYQFKQLVAKIGLSGVEHPFWEDHPVDIVRVLSLDLLHGGYKAFQDHQISWITNLVGASDLDNRIIAQPHRMGSRSFPQGIAKLSQFSGRETRDLMTMIVPAMARAERVPGGAERAIAAKVDFLYKAHQPIHSDATLLGMQHDLEKYEKVKKVFIETGARRRGKKATDVIRHFRIPKEHNHHHFVNNIKDLGPMNSTSTEPVEFSHKANAKIPYAFSNKKNYLPQFITYVTRRDQIEHFQRFLDYRDNYDSFYRHLSGSSHSLNAFVFQQWAPTAPPYAKKPDRSTSTSKLASSHDMSDLPSALFRYFCDPKLNNDQKKGFLSGNRRRFYGYNHLPLQYQCLQLWNRFRIISQPLNRFYPPDRDIVRCEEYIEGKPALYFDSVLVRLHSSGDINKRYRPAEIRLIFAPSIINSDDQSAPLYAYVLWFSKMSAPDKLNGLRTVEKDFTTQGRAGGIVPIRDIVSLCPLAPVLHDNMEKGKTTPNNSMQEYAKFWVNRFGSHSDYALFAEI